MAVNIIHTEFVVLLGRVGVTQAAFARLCGVSSVTVNAWCRGRYPVPQWAYALANACALFPTAALVPPPQFAWHEVLSVTPDATMPVIAAARTRLAKKYHPDAGGDTDAMQRINAAFDLGKKLRG